jgi:hypothetical protein
MSGAPGFSALSRAVRIVSLGVFTDNLADLNDAPPAPARRRE